MRIRAAALVLLAPLAVSLAACSDTKDDAGSSNPSGAAGAPTTLKLGYFPNVTHATAILGVEKGIFAKDLGQDKLETKTFNAGGAAVEALLSGAIDASFVGPNAALTAYSKSGNPIRIIAGATSGGAALVVKASISSVTELKGKKIATPQLGNTQDVALRSYLKDNGLKTDSSGGGDVHVLPQDNATTLQAFQQGAIDGAWVPEPWASRLVQDGGGKVLVNEASLWPDGKFVTTELIVAKKFLDAHPDTVKHLLEGLIEANTYINANSAASQAIVNEGIKKISGKALKDAIIQAAWKNLTFTLDPIASSLATAKAHAVELGLLKDVDIANLYDLGPLNALLSAASQTPVPAPSLGTAEVQ